MAHSLDSARSIVTLWYAGWQVWDGEFGEIRVGGDFAASVEFVPRSSLELAESNTDAQIRHLHSNWYRATAMVLDTSGEAVVLDLGAFRALKWIRPGEGSGGFHPATTVNLELSLNLSGWMDTPWTNRAAELYGSNHTWRVHRILRFSVGDDTGTEIDEAVIETVDSVDQHCLLECSLVGQHPGARGTEWT